MHIERHVFGSYKGYTTLARSAGVTLDDCRIIERCAFSVGQTYDSKFYKSLGRNPAYFTQVFPGNRRGLTRITDGKADDQGRPTFCYLTLILPRAQWDQELLGDIGALAGDRELWKWNDSGDIQALDVSVPGDPAIGPRYRNPALLLISQLERTLATRRPVAVSESDVSFEVIRAVEMLLPVANRGNLTTAYRLLSSQFPASVITLADVAASAATFRPDERAGYSRYAQVLKTSGIESGNVPQSVVRSYREFGVASPASPATLTTNTIVVESETSKRSWVAVGLAGLAGLCIGAAIGALVLSTLTRSKMEADGLVQHNGRWLTANEKAFAEKEATLVPFRAGWASEEDVNAHKAKKLLDGDEWRTKDEVVEQLHLRDGLEKYHEGWLPPERIDKIKAMETASLTKQMPTAQSSGLVNEASLAGPGSDTKSFPLSESQENKQGAGEGVTP